MVIPWNSACVEQVLIGWKLIFGCKVQRHQIHCTVERFLTNQNPDYRMSPSVWLVENRSTVQCICWLWTSSSYPKISFQPIWTLTQVQICGMTVGHVSFRWTCIALHSVFRPAFNHFTTPASEYIWATSWENLSLGVWDQVEHKPSCSAIEIS